MKDKAGKVAIVKKLVEKGKKKGNLTYKEIMEEVEGVELTPEQIEKIYEVLESMGIDVIGLEPEVEEEEEVEIEVDITIPEGIAIDDPVRMYLKEMTTVRDLNSVPMLLGGLDRRLQELLQTRLELLEYQYTW